MFHGVKHQKPSLLSFLNLRTESMIVALSTFINNSFSYTKFASAIICSIPIPYSLGLHSQVFAYKLRASQAGDNIPEHFLE